VDKVVYLKMITGEDVVATVGDNQVFDELDEIEIIDPFVIHISKSQGFYEYTAVRWGMFLNEKYDYTFYIPTKHILIFGDANDQVIEMYDNWTNDSREAESISIPDEQRKSEMDEDMLEAYEQKYKEYLKKVH
jgi:hypothetical protein